MAGIPFSFPGIINIHETPSIFHLPEEPFNKEIITGLDRVHLTSHPRRNDKETVIPTYPLSRALFPRGLLESNQACPVIDSL